MSLTISTLKYDKNTAQHFVYEYLYQDENYTKKVDIKSILNNSGMDVFLNVLINQFELEDGIKFDNNKLLTYIPENIKQRLNLYNVINSHIHLISKKFVEYINEFKEFSSHDFVLLFFYSLNEVLKDHKDKININDEEFEKTKNNILNAFHSETIKSALVSRP